jgi:Bacterial Ig domain
MDTRKSLSFDGVLVGAAAALLVAVLAGCGGGLQLGIGTSSNDPPTVALVAGAASGVRGNALVLFADASDDDAVARVVFFRVNEDDSSTDVGSDSSRPYSLEVTLPVAATFPGTSVRYFARAVDSDDETTDSATVSVELFD